MSKGKIHWRVWHYSNLEETCQWPWLQTIQQATMNGNGLGENWWNQSGTISQACDGKWVQSSGRGQWSPGWCTQSLGGGGDASMSTRPTSQAMCCLTNTHACWTALICERFLDVFGGYCYRRPAECLLALFHTLLLAATSLVCNRGKCAPAKILRWLV